MAPQLREIGIDRLFLTVKGTWRADPRRFSGADYLEAVGTNRYEPWFRGPSPGPTRIVLNPRTPLRATIGLTVKVRRQGHAGDLSVEIRCNPTRTLAHLLQLYGSAVDFPSVISALHPHDFFARATDVSRSLDGGDNWISDISLLHAVLGDEPFDAFLPIFFTQLQRLIVSIVSPSDDPEVSDDHGDMELIAPGCRVRVAWSTVSAPQIETYFERYHGDAQAAVRRAALTALSALDDAWISRHPYVSGFERDRDLFSVISSLPYERKLAIYAKAPERVRCEIRRYKGRGQYHNNEHGSSIGRLLNIASGERDFLLTAAAWDRVGSLFADLDSPMLEDLVRLATFVADVCTGVDAEAGHLMRMLLVDAGLTRDRNNAPLVDALENKGVVRRINVRDRERKDRVDRRYVLTPDFLALIERLHETLGR